MNIVFITPGTGSYFCGLCMRDNALVQALRGHGHDALMMPMYLPTMIDEPSVADGMPIFFGGINVYLQQKSAVFRHTPEWLDNLLNARPLLRMAGKKAGMTGGADIGDMTISMLRGEEGKQRKEIRKVVRWLVDNAKPDVIYLSTALQIGLARMLKEELKVPVVCFLQGEDSFLDTLRSPLDKTAWQVLAERAADVDEFIAPSHYFADLMASRMGLDPGQVRVIPNGIATNGYMEPGRKPPEKPTIGYLARMVTMKGLNTLVDAYCELKKDSRHEDVRLKIAGSTISHDEPFLSKLRKKLKSAGCDGSVTWHPNLSRDEKVAFLRGLTLFSVPATYGEAFGLYVIEAMAAGVPVVQPRHGAFPEILQDTQGGVLCEPDDPKALAAAFDSLISDSSKITYLGECGQNAVRQRYTVDYMAVRLVENAAEVWEKYASAHGGRAAKPAPSDATSATR